MCLIITQFANNNLIGNYFKCNFFYLPASLKLKHGKETEGNAWTHATTH